MPSSERANWQPISQMPLVASMIDGALSDTADHLQTLTKARAQPHVLDDATIDRVERVHREQLQFVDIYAEQLRRWQDQGPSAAGAPGTGPPGRDEPQLAPDHHRSPHPDHRAPPEAPSTASFAMSDLELGLQALLGTLPPGRS